MQVTQNTGNGVRATVGAMLIDNATLVRGPAGSGSGTLLMAISNRGKEEDQLVSVTIGGAEATMEPAGPVAVPTNGIVRFGFNADHWVNTYSLDAPISGYVPVQLTFAKAGVLSISVLTVEPTGYYAGITPNPATPPPAPLS
jgi:copper(I)-binding protein